MKKNPLLFFIFLVLLISGCSTTWWSAEKVLPKPYTGTINYVIKTFGNFSSDQRLYKDIKFYYKAEPKWGPIQKIKRRVGGGLDINDIVEHPFVWRRETINEPLVLIKSRAGFLNIIIMTLRHGRECVMNRYNLSQSTFQDATQDPTILTGSRDVDAIGVREGSGNGFIDDYRVECDDYDKIPAVKL